MSDIKSDIEEIRKFLGYHPDDGDIAKYSVWGGYVKPETEVVTDAFADIVIDLCNIMPDNSEKLMCLRRLLEAKDCALRSVQK